MFVNLISEIPIARKKANKFCNARQRQLIAAAAIRGGRKHMGTAAADAAEVRGDDDNRRKKWDLCSGGDGVATAEDGGGREGEPQRRNGSFEFAGDVFLHSHHHNLAGGGVDFCVFFFKKNEIFVEYSREM